MLFFASFSCICFEAISKTDLPRTISMDSVEIVCPPNLNRIFNCVQQIPSAPISFTDEVTGDDLSDFLAIGGEIEGLNGAELIVVAFDDDDSSIFSGSFDLPMQIRRTLFVYVDLNMNNKPEEEELLEACLINFILQNDITPSCRTTIMDADDSENPPLLGSTTGEDISFSDVSCPPNPMNVFQCMSLVPPIESALTDDAPGSDLSDFQSYGGNVTGTPNGFLVIKAFDEDDSDIFDGCIMGPIQIRRTFRIWDDANMDGMLEDTEFVFTCLVNYIVVDVVPPIWVNEDLDQDLDCDDGLVIAVPTATDPCTIMSMNLVSDETVTTGDCANKYTRTIVYEATDRCGNRSDTTVIIRVNDDVPPIITAVPTNAVFECGNPNITAQFDTWIANNGGATATENCGDIIWSTNIGRPVPGCGGSSSTTVTFIASDECGNQSIPVSADFITIDTSPPFIEPGNLPNFPDLMCGDPLPPITPIMGSDLCTNNVMVSNAEVTMTAGDDCSGKTVTYTWTLMDGCGNASTADVSFEILPDNVDPVFTFMPSQVVPLQCDDVFPAFQNLTASDNCGAPTIMTSSSVTDNSPCIGNTLTYTWTATDQCKNSTSVSIDIDILPDIEPPNLVCNEELIIEASGTSCSAFVNLTPPTVTDNCTDYTVTSNIPGNQGTFPVGTHIITWEASAPGCGVDATCIQTLTVKDSSAPQLDCPEQEEVCINTTGSGSLCAADLFTALDNCPGDLDESIVLVEDLCNQPSNSAPDDKTIFCCDQIGETVTLVAEVEDSAGNIATCTIEIIVRDKVDPVCSISLPNITISCTYEYDLFDLSEFGNYVDDIDDVTTNTITDPVFGIISISDGFISDNCDLSIEEIAPTVDVQCGGTIIRNFEATDPSGNMTVCTQTITLDYQQSFNETNIIWPESPITITNECITQIPDPPVNGEATVQNVSCAQILRNHSDEYFNVSPGCFRLERTWSIIDWCQFEPNADPPRGRWEFIQVIEVINNNAPVFTACDDITLCGNEADCTGLITTEISATDDCGGTDLNYAYVVNIGNDTDTSNDFNGTGNSITDMVVPYGTHEISWLANDGCGNTNSCIQLVEVEDCKKPIAACFYGIAINLNQMPQGIMAEIWAKDYDASSSDNCTALEDLEFAFDADFTQPFLQFDCDDLGVQDIFLFVKDEFGNTSSCETYINVQDNYNLCPSNLKDNDDGEMARISGKIYNILKEELLNVDVFLESSTMDLESLTNEKGDYAFEDVPMYDDIILTPTMEDRVLNGISTLDLLYIQRHILKLHLLPTPYQIIAADVNNSQSVTALDIIELRKLILGVQDKFSHSKSWKFLDASITFEDSQNPFPVSEIMTMPKIDHNAEGMNFIGIKIGDVDNSYVSSATSTGITSGSNLNNIPLYIQKLERGLIQITVKQQTVFNGFQFDIELEPNTKLVNVHSDWIDINASNFSQRENIVSFSWSSAESVEIDNDVLFTFQLDKESDVKSVDNTMADEMYDNELRIYDIDLKATSDQDWQVFRNTPNPFTNETILSFFLPTNSNVSLSIFDSSGKKIFSETKGFQAGKQIWTVDAVMLGNVHGVLYYRLESGDKSSTQPFIRLE